MARLVAVIAAVAAQEPLNSDDSSGLLQSNAKVSTKQLNLKQLVEEPNKRRFCRNRDQFPRDVGVARICKPGYDPIDEGCYEHCPPGWLSALYNNWWSCWEPCALRNNDGLDCGEEELAIIHDEEVNDQVSINDCMGLCCDCAYRLIDGERYSSNDTVYNTRLWPVNRYDRHFEVTVCPQSTQIFEDGLCFDPPPANYHCSGITCYRDCGGNNEQPLISTVFCQHPNEASDGMDLRGGWGDSLNELPQEVQEMVWSSSAINYQDVQECADMCMTNPLCMGFVAMDGFQDEQKECVFKAYLQCAQADEHHSDSDEHYDEMSANRAIDQDHNQLHLSR